MKRHDLIAVACIALMFWPQLSGMVPKDATVEPVVAPSAELQLLVAQVTTALDSGGGPTVAAFYGQFAMVVAGDKAVLTNTGQFREGHRRAAMLMLKGGPLAGKYPDADGAISTAIAKYIGLDNVPIDSAERQRIVDVLNAVAWAAGEAK